MNLRNGASISSARQPTELRLEGFDLVLGMLSGFESVSALLFGPGFSEVVGAAQEPCVDGVGLSAVLPFLYVVDFAPPGGRPTPRHAATSVSVNDRFSGRPSE